MPSILSFRRDHDASARERLQGLKRSCDHITPLALPRRRARLRARNKEAMEQRLAVYAGSFDPPTVGHLWMVRQGATLFDRLHVALGVNPDKRALFTVEERLEMLREITRDMPNVSVHSFTNQFLVRYAESVGARFVLRGIRSAADFEYERSMRNINSDHAPQVTSVFLIPPRDIAEVSSSFVKGLVGPDGWEELVRHYVAFPVFERIMRKRHDGL